ncbi:MAG: lysophospholipid acyltransferase family protein [Putridiphycobacter sp.]
MGVLKKNVFGQYVFVKKNVIRVFGALVYPRFNWINKPEIEGAEILQSLPDKNVLFVSNHQTYFADVSFFLHIFHAALKGRPNNIKYPGFFFVPKDNIYYVAAEETMKSGLLPKILALSGAVTVKRTWRANGKDVKRDVDKKEVEQIDTALEDGWVITFPQGTTTPYVKGRKGTAVIIKKHNPIVVPIVIDGFRRAFDKKGVKLKKKHSKLKVRIKAPLDYQPEASAKEILDKIMVAIEQTSDFDFMEQVKSKKEEE